MRLNWLVLGALFLVITGCAGIFGEKTDLEFIDVPIFDNRQIAYVPIQPALTGLEEPIDVIAGYDQLIYVVDAGSQEVIAFDQSGVEQGRLFVQGATEVAQDRSLDLLVIGTYDTTLNGTEFTLAAVYRYDLNSPEGYGLANARVKRRIIHPFYFRTGTPGSRDEQVQFHGLAIMGNNEYFISRTGPSNVSTQFGGPDNAVLRFSDDDQFVTPVTVSTSLGFFTNYFQQPRGLTSFAQPPQSPAVNRAEGFVFTSVSPNQVLKVQYIDFISNDFGASYEVRSLNPPDTSRADGYLYEPGRFERPVDITLAGDGTNYLFVVDAARDSLYQFNGLGFEGVNPPAGSRSTKAVVASFGGTGESLTQFRRPSGVAYLNRIVYVADAGNGRVLRFQLTTDFD